MNKTDNTDKKIPVKSFQEYCEIYVRSANNNLEEGQAPLPLVSEVCSDRWEVSVTLSPDGQFNQVSFVNSICTIAGGSHVGHVTDQLVQVLIKKAQAANKKGTDILY
jgi:DNA topoisomerase II